MTTTQIDMPARAPSSTPPEVTSWQDGRGRSQHGKLVKWAVIATVLVAALAAGWVALRSLGRIDTSEAILTFKVQPRTFDVLLSEKGELDAANKIDIKCEVEGRTRIIWLVPEGKQVEKGELLVELASDQIDDRVQQQEIRESATRVAYEAAAKEHDIQLDENASDIRKAELALKLARLNLEKYEKGQSVQQLRDADLEIERAKTVLDRRTEELKYSEELVAKKYITQSEYKDEQFRKYEAGVALEKAELAKMILLAYSHPTDLEQAQSNVHEAEKELERVIKSAEANEAKSLANRDGKRTEWTYTKQQLDKLREQKSKCKITAPGAGLVVYANEDSGWRGGGGNRIAEGEEVYERQSILSIPDTSAMKVIVRVHEAKTDKIKLDQPARIEVEGFPGEQFIGKVTKIAAVADSRNRWLNPDLKEYRTEITLDGSRPELKPGMTARAEIFVERAENALAVPVQSVFSKGGKNYVFAERGRSAEPVEVQLGRSNTEFVEVLSGLKKGLEVRMVVDDALKRKLPEADNNGAGENEDAWKTRPPAPSRRDEASPGRPPGGERQGGRRAMRRDS